MHETLREWRIRQNQERVEERELQTARNRQLDDFDELAYTMSYGVPRGVRPHATVISTHVSKSVLLPVVSLAREDLGLQVVLRNNWYNWKMSVVSREPITADFTGLFIETPPPEPEYTGDDLAPVYFEGFPSDLIFGYRTTDSPRWSAQISNTPTLHIALFLIMRSLGAVRPLAYRTRASHEEELKCR